MLYVFVPVFNTSLMALIRHCWQTHFGDVNC